MSRNHLAFLLILSLLTACSSVKMGGIGPHRIDVQQGNALDQESVAKLKPGLTRSQVRFLLGTPLLVDPFRNNRWDYVYTFYKGGKLAEQKRITLFFDNDILQRMEGDVPVVEAAVAQPDAASTPTPVAPTSPMPSASAESIPLEAVKKPEPVAQVTPSPTAPAPPVRPATVPAQTALAPAVVIPSPVVVTPAKPATEPAPAPKSNSRPVAPPPAVSTSVVAPLSVPQTPGVVTPRTAADLQLHPETNVAQIRPDVIPPFPDPNTPPAASATEASVLRALKAWSDAWLQGNADAYIAAYAPDYLPPGEETHAAWEKRRRTLLGVSKNVELRIVSPKVKMAADGHALVTFHQYYRSTNYRDDLVKQIKLAQREGRWVIVEERVVNTLQPPKL